MWIPKDKQIEQKPDKNTKILDTAVLRVMKDIAGLEETPNCTLKFDKKDLKHFFLEIRPDEDSWWHKGKY